MSQSLGPAIVGAFIDAFGLPDHRKPRFRSVLHTKRPLVGVSNILSWSSKHAGSALGSAIHADGAVAMALGDIPVNGKRPIVPVNKTPLTIRLQLNPLSYSCDCIPPSVHEWTVNVQAAALRFRRLYTPWFAHTGKQMTAWWDCPGADRVVVYRDDGYKIVDHLGQSKGYVTLFSDHPGKIILRLEATNAFSHVVAHRVIRVMRSTPRINVLHPTQSALPGEQVMYEWDAANAQKVWLESANEQHELEPSGRFFVTMQEYPQTFVLFARHLNVTRSVTLKAVPWYGIEGPGRVA